MNKKLKFNDGGQPVYLDDLKTIQDNHFNVWKSMFGVMTMNTEAFLMESVDKEYKSGGRVKVGSGEIVVNGVACRFEGKELTTSNPIYILIKRSNEDYREFADGQTRSCIETMTATLSTSTAGADTAYKLDELETFLDLLGKAMEANKKKEEAVVTFMNGYSGKVSIRKSSDGTDTEMVLDIRSSETQWNPDAPGYKGMLFRIDNENVVQAFRGKVSKKFVHAGVEYRLGFTDGSIAAIVSLELASGRDNYYEDSYVLPLIPISATFKASDFTEH